jgi:hypothetical protein
MKRKEFHASVKYCWTERTFSFAAVLRRERSFRGTRG